MEKEPFLPHENTIARPDFNPFNAFHSDTVKYIHVSKIELERLASEQGVSLPEIEDEIVIWGPEGQKHSEAVAKQFNVDFRKMEKDGRFINAGAAILITNNDLVLLGTSGDLNDEQGKSFFSQLRTKDGVEKKTAANLRTIELLRGIYGDDFTYDQKAGFIG